MKRLLLLLAAALLFACSGAQAQPAGRFATTRGTQFIDASGKPILLRGINLGNWLVPEGYMFKFERATAPWQIAQVVSELVGPVEAARFWRQWQDTFITADDIAYIKQSGLNSIRVPFSFRLFTTEDTSAVWSERGFELLDRVVGWSRAQGLYVVLDLHAAPCGQTGENIDDSRGYPWLFEDEACQQRTVDLWRRIAARYAGEPTILGYDLLNEPIPHYPEYQRLNERLEPLYRRIVTAIREVDPNHVIFLGGAQWNTNFKVFGAPFDPKLAYTFHRYWTPPTDSTIADFVAFRDRHRVPLWLGESGENDDAWVAAFRQTLERNQIGWCFWPYKKMDATSNMRTYPQPPGWDQVIAYQKLFGGTFEEKRAARPDPAVVREALRALLASVRFAQTRENRGYVQALGLP